MKVRNENSEYVNMWWVVVIAVGLTICVIGMGKIGYRDGYKQGQIDAIEGRIKYEQTGYVKIKGGK